MYVMEAAHFYVAFGAVTKNYQLTPPYKFDFSAIKLNDGVTYVHAMGGKTLCRSEMSLVYAGVN